MYGVRPHFDAVEADELISPPESCLVLNPLIYEMACGVYQLLAGVRS